MSDADELTDAVLTASRLLVAVSARSLAAVEETLTLPQFRMLVLLESRGPMKLTALADLLEVNPSTAKRMIDRLITSGMAEREQNPATKREVVVVASHEGRRVVGQVMARRRAEIGTIVARMPKHLRHGLVEALTAFAEAGGEPRWSARDEAPERAGGNAEVD
ncbi:MarR family winged helix-turn-helix transcriptional regulator [Lentzea nigeriaca]|uniref:MarR family winged helix-turn-helix transcriptional regulator n=1 Tax=Lentzea nigeriaca TaxID=1128665 RepID=UPI0027DD2C56|nr:MarR family transcriptional regulator [Lentzea nigeriaca]MBM7857436.1 DNA-binding MarR family transcriptional regulator [Lentzea nigeriaca]